MRRSVTYEGMSSAELQSIAEGVMPGGYGSFIRRLRRPVVIRRAKGARLWDVEGNEYIDFYCGAGPVILGHSDEEVNRAAFAALETLDLTGVGNTVLEIELAEKLVEHIPSADLVLLCNGGSDATVNAARLARAVTGKTDLVRMHGAYHGWHDYLLAATPGWTVAQGGVLEDGAKHTWAINMNDMDAIDDVVRKSGHQVAAVFVEPLLHNAGYIPPLPGYLEALREYCTDNGIVLVFDEVITGFRHHLGGYQAICGVVPDITTVAKAMANGYPIAAICGKRDLMLHFNPAPGGTVFYAGTYNGHAGPVAAALATIEALEDGKVHQHIFMLGDRLRHGLGQIIERVGLDAFVTGYGSCWVVYFKKPSPVRSFADLIGPDYDVTKDQRSRELLYDKGFCVVPYPRRRGYISAAHTIEDIDRLLCAAEDVLRQVARE